MTHAKQVVLAALRRIGSTSLQTAVTGAVVAVCAVFVFWTVHPSLVLTNNTPTGGDMGSHVWGPMFLMREALPRGQANWWAPDWYAGFPAFQFYMVVPMLAIAVLHLGIRSPLVVVALPAVLALVPLGWFVPRLHRWRWALFGVGLFLTLLVLPVPYGVAFKLVAVSGLVGMPVAAWALGRMAGAPFPIPPALAVGSLFFLYNIEPTLNSGTGNIIGGNMTSTMAGEFSFSISLTLSLLYLGCLIRGLRTGRGRATTAAVLALCGLCHIIPAFYAIGATAVALVVWPGRARLRWFWPIGPVAGLLGAFWVVPFAGRHAYVNDMGWEPLPHTYGGDDSTLWQHLDGPARALALVAAAALVGGIVAVAGRLTWRHAHARRIAGAAVAAAATAAVAAGWLLTRVTVVEAGLGPDQQTPSGDPAQTVWSYLRPDALTIPLIVAALGLVVGIVFHQRLAYLLAAMAAGGAIGFLAVPDGRLWNARLLPLFYLGLFLLAALAVAEVLRAIAILVSAEPERPTVVVATVMAAPLTIAALVFLGGPLALEQVPTGGTTPDGGATLLGIDRTFRNPGSGWARFNFRGLEGQPPRQIEGEGTSAIDDSAATEGGWPEYRALVATMAALGEDDDHGCGRAMWEFDRDRVQSYGTTMSLMMLPYFTDGCIGSMEGLYFESSTTTPHHFITQCKLSEQGSCSQRQLAYSGFDLSTGISQLELLGVRYYVAATDRAVEAASAEPRLTEVAVSGPWHVYELDADRRQLVVGLDHLPVVLEGVEPVQDSWLDPAIAWFNDPSLWDVPFAIEGPDEWPRVELPEVAEVTESGEPRRIGGRDLPDFPAEEVDRAQVTDIVDDGDRVSFTVDEPGTPVLVKVSYFPNWRVEGADGPYRVSPNLMVVVPTDTEVTLSYGRTALDRVAYLLSVLGVAGLVALWWIGPVPIPEGLLDRRRRERAEAAAAARAAVVVAGPPGEGFGAASPDRPAVGVGSDAPVGDEAELDEVGAVDRVDLLTWALAPWTETGDEPAAGGPSDEAAPEATSVPPDAPDAEPPPGTPPDR